MDDSLYNKQFDDLMLWNAENNAEFEILMYIKSLRSYKKEHLITIYNQSSKKQEINLDELIWNDTTITLPLFE